MVDDLEQIKIDDSIDELAESIVLLAKKPSSKELNAIHMLAEFVVTGKVMKTIDGVEMELAYDYSKEYESLMKNKGIRKNRDELVSVIRESLPEGQDNDDLLEVLESAHLMYELKNPKSNEVSPEYALTIMKVALQSSPEGKVTKEQILNRLLKGEAFQDSLVYKDSKGSTLVDTAVSMGYYKEAKLLMSHGASFDASEAKWEDKLKRLMPQHIELYKILINNGANVNLGVEIGNSLLNQCSQIPRLNDLAKLLLENGAEFNAETLKENASFVGNQAFIDLIDAHVKATEPLQVKMDRLDKAHEDKTLSIVNKSKDQPESQIKGRDEGKFASKVSHNKDSGIIFRAGGTARSGHFKKSAEKSGASESKGKSWGAKAMLNKLKSKLGSARGK